MFRWMWRKLLGLFGLGKGPGRGNEQLQDLYRKKTDGWVKDVTGVVVWVKVENEAELAEHRRRFWRHVWRSFKELFGAKKDHRNRYPHQIFKMEIEGSDGLEVRVENNLFTGRKLRGVKKGLRVEVGGEYLPHANGANGGKLHHTHGKNGYVSKR